MDLAAQLGSDVPFFLLGGSGTSAGEGDGAVSPAGHNQRSGALLVAPEVHVSTPGAYRDLGRELTSEAQQNKINSFQSSVWRVSEGSLEQGENDFESVVFSGIPG